MFFYFLDPFDFPERVDMAIFLAADNGDFIDKNLSFIMGLDAG
jgi:hypothetical protein